MDVIISQFFTGASTGAVLLLVALGLALTFGQMGVINMAHGEFLMAGAYTAYLTQQVVSNSDVSLLIALPLGFLVAGLLGLLLEMTVISRMYHRPLDTLLVTFGVGLILQQLARDVFGARPRAVASPGWLHGQIDILGYGYPVTRLFIVAIAVGCLVGHRGGAEVHRARSTDPRHGAEPGPGRDGRCLHPGHRPRHVLPRLRPGRHRRRRVDPRHRDRSPTSARPTSCRPSWSSCRAASGRSRDR